MKRTIFAFIIAISLAPTLGYAGTCGGIFNPKATFEQVQKNAAGPLSYRFEKLENPLPINSYLQISGRNWVTDKNGVRLGFQYKFDPYEKNVASLRQDRGGLKPYRTEMTAVCENLYLALGFKQAEHPVYGVYFEKVPNPDLFEALRARYNATVAEDMRVHIGVHQSTVVSEHQTEIVRNWVHHGTFAMGDPKLGSVFGLKPEELAQEVTGGKELNSIFRHDLEHFGSILLIPKKPVDINRQVGRFWEQVLALMRKKVIEKELIKGQGVWRDLMDDAYVYVRRFHSLTHVVGMLTRAGGSVDVNTYSITDFGQVANLETPTVHWVGLGARPNWVTPASLPFSSRLLEIGLTQSQVFDRPYTLVDAYRAVTNEAIDSARAMAARYPQYATEFNQFFKAAELNTLTSLSSEELLELQELTLRRYRAMGN